jgi:hypothetical protein
LITVRTVARSLAEAMPWWLIVMCGWLLAMACHRQPQLRTQ